MFSVFPVSNLNSHSHTAMTPLEIEIASTRALLELFENAIEKAKQSGEISDAAYNRHVAHIRAFADQLEEDMQDMGICD